MNNTSERRRSKVNLGRRSSDIPVRALEKFKEAMLSGLEKTVENQINGKLRDLKETVLTKADFNLYVQEDMKWKTEQENYKKESTEPTVKKVGQAADFFIVLKAIIGFLVLIGGGVVAWATIKNKLLS